MNTHQSRDERSTMLPHLKVTMLKLDETEKCCHFRLKKLVHDTLSLEHELFADVIIPDSGHNTTEFEKILARQ